MKHAKKTKTPDHESQPKATTAHAEIPVGLFDPANPWPEGSEIVYATGETCVFKEVDLEHGLLIVQFLGKNKEAWKIDDWNNQAGDVEEIRFPEASAVSASSAVNSLVKFSASSESSPSPEPCSAKPATQGEAESRFPGDSSSVQKLPIPRPSDVDISLIDVVHNVRSNESLFDESLKALGANIEQQGQIEAVKLMRITGGRYRLLDGERRYRSAVAEGLSSLRAEVYDEALSESQILRFQLSTFATRKDLTHREWAQALGEYAAPLSLSAAAVARDLGLGDDFVRKHMAYLSWPESIQRMVDDGKMSLNKALTCGRLPADQQETIAQRAWLHGWSETQLAEEVNKTLGHDPAAGGLLPEAAAASPSTFVPGPDDVCCACGRIADGDKGEFYGQIAGKTYCGGCASKLYEGPTSVSGSTDEYDQVNERRKARIEEAPITGTKATTANERFERAQADAEASMPPAKRIQRTEGEGEATGEGEKFPPTVISLGGKLALFLNADCGTIESNGKVLLTLQIAGFTRMVQARLVLTDLYDNDLAAIRYTLTTAHKAAKKTPDKAKKKKKK